MQEAHNKIYSRIKKGENFSEIVKTKFDIDGKVTGFNINKIKKIQENFEPKVDESNVDADNAKVFKLFRQGVSPTDVIIKTKLSSDFVKKSWNEYVEINDSIIIPNNFFKQLKKIMKSGGIAPSDYSQKAILNAVREYVEISKDFYALTDSCEFCNDLMDFQGKHQKKAKSLLSELHQKYYCG